MKRSSDIVEKRFQLALLKLVKHFLLLLFMLCCSVVAMFMMIGRWSECSVVWVCHSQEVRREGEAREMSGEVGELFKGSRVGVLVFKVPKLE